MSETFRLVCPHCAVINRVAVARDPRAAKCGACKQPLFAAHPTEVDSASLERHLRADLPVLLDVWAPWCGPCRAMAPAFARAAQVLEPEIRLLKLNADSAPEFCAQLGVQGIPALFLFQAGRVIARTTGAMDANAIVAWARRRAMEDVPLNRR